MNLGTCNFSSLSIIVCLAIFFQSATAMAAADCRAPVRIQFEKGSSAAMLHGGIVRAEDVCYALSARAGQTLEADIKSPDENVVFSLYRPGYIVKPGSDGLDITGPTMAGAGNQDDATSLHAKLPASGRYLFLLGTTRGGGGEYQLHVQVR
ncbi:MAG: hypothetical protein ACRYFY_06750 [Janthinobacterium lividum]